MRLSKAGRGPLALICVLTIGGCASRTVVTGTGSGAGPEASSPPASPPPVAPDNPEYAAVAAQIVRRTNEARASEGLSQLATNARLTVAARLQAEQMARAGRMEHNLPNAPYPALKDRLAAAGYDWSATAENIALDYREAAAAVDGWMRSPSHRANMLSATYTEMGGGYATGAGGHRYYVQVFGRPAEKR